MGSHLIQTNAFEAVKGILSGFWLAFRLMWPLLLLAIVLVFIRFGAERLGDELGSRVKQFVLGRRFSMRAKWRNDRHLLRDLRAIDPPEFEHYIAALFSKLGYRTTVVGGPNDGGIDVIAVKDGIEHYSGR